LALGNLERTNWSAMVPVGTANSLSASWESVSIFWRLLQPINTRITKAISNTVLDFIFYLIIFLFFAKVLIIKYGAEQNKSGYQCQNIYTDLLINSFSNSILLSGLKLDF
jgi:hypothetical protein